VGRRVIRPASQIFELLTRRFSPVLVQPSSWFDHHPVRFCALFFGMAHDTGTTSVHFGKKDVDRIGALHWEDIGPSKVLTRALRDAERLEEAKEKVERAKRGDINLAELMTELENL